MWGSETLTSFEKSKACKGEWCALSCSEVLGPFFFAEQTVTVMTYLDVLQLYLLSELEDQLNVVFQQDDVPLRWACIVREFLDMHFPARWVRRDGPIPWPPRSSDITLLDFFWGYVKHIVYKTLVTSLDERKLKIVAAIETVTPQMLENTWKEIEYRLGILRAKKGTHVEVVYHSEVLIL
jgi:hypothetical protein